MRKTKDSFMNERHFPIVTHMPAHRALKGFAQASYTVFLVPKHDASLSIDAAFAQNKHQALQPTIPTELANIRNVLKTNASTVQHPFILRPKDIFGLTGIIMQFSSYLPDLIDYIRTPFEPIDQLHQSIIKEGRHSPLSFSRQLEISLRQTDGDILEAVWRLFLTARLNARWYDGQAIVGMPNFTREQKKERMVAFSNAVAACKTYSPNSPQDIAGDAYYCWTHTLGSLVFNTPRRQKHRLMRRIFTILIRNGTWFNHNLAHKFKPQALKSDHTIAAAYGNVIGSACLDSSSTAFSQSASDANARNNGVS